MQHCRTALLRVCLFSCSGLTAQEEELLRRGISSMNASQPVEAEKIFKAILAKNPQANSARVLLGFVFLQRAAVEDAQEAFDRALAFDPDSAPAHYGMGVTLLRKGLAERARTEFQKILRDPSLGMQAQLQEVQSLFILGRYDEALDSARRLAVAFPDNPEYHRYLGFLYQAGARHGEALSEYLRAIELKPGQLPPYLDAISAYGALQQWQEAADLAERALDLDWNQPTLHQALASALEKLGKTDEADDARRAAERTFSAEQLNIRAGAAISAGLEIEGEKLLRECVGVNPQLSNAWTRLGEILLRSDRRGEARESLSMAVETDPDNVAALLDLADLYRADGKPEESLRIYQKALARGLGSPDVLTGLASAYLRSGNKERAAALMAEAVQQLPDSPELLSYYGYLNESSGSSLEALRSYSEALRMSPRQVDAIVGLGRGLESRGDQNGAVEAFRKAIKLNSSDRNAWRGLIQTLRNTGSWPAAIQASKDCLRDASGDSECREQLASLEMQTGLYSDASRDFTSLLEAGRSSKPVLEGLAFSLAQQGHFATAIQLWQRSVDNYGADAWVFSQLGYAFRSRGNIHAAIDSYRKARRIAPGDADKAYDLAFALYLGKEHAAAVEPFLAALRLRPGWGLAHYNLAITYWNLRQYDKALAHARSARNQGVLQADTVIRTLSRPIISLQNAPTR